jgi:hypothetical protein
MQVIHARRHISPQAIWCRILPYLHATRVSRLSTNVWRGIDRSDPAQGESLCAARAGLHKSHQASDVDQAVR